MCSLMVDHARGEEEGGKVGVEEGGPGGVAGGEEF